MKLTIVGTGSVGLVTGACLAELGNEVLCVDPDATRVARLQRGDLPVREAGLAEIVARNRAAGRLHFTTDPHEGVAFAAIQILAIVVPPESDGTVDMGPLLRAAQSIGRHMSDYKLVINRGTVPVGTAEAVHAAIADGLAEHGRDLPYSVVSNPEFGVEGAAVDACLNPDRIVVGLDEGDARARHLMQALWAPLQRARDRMVWMNVRSAELSRYATSAMMAMRLTFMNELARLAGKLGADIDQVRQGVGADRRVGPDGLQAGCGYGGTGLSRDVEALLYTAQALDEPMMLLNAVECANERQKRLLVEHIVGRFGDNLQGRRFALWGLAHQPDSCDMHEAPSKVVINELLRRGAQVLAYDPMAMSEARRLYFGVPGLGFAISPLEAAAGADALVVMTDWPVFASPDFDQLATVLRQPVIFDGRNMYAPETMRDLGFDYVSIGRAAASTGVEPDSVHVDLPLAA
ncbi:UDP-glucose 6-dehydrogenase [Rubrivivax sp. A210]|uniref:UDP-glucose dehydrogenase family protein n=1 Tax=Rubrivivax sp. A210 TaxID=2772301 RepID=UPI00191AC620|nr:UDP-glucose/GDP-mannose dehydrogenase family protein [Rubrivivax sp. A210]CAD5366286.1 UDP-glucose 6-dehydrogenase [Rubrivivax sp. A210]